MLKFSRIIPFVALFLIFSCAQAKKRPSDSEVFAWARINLEVAFSQTDRIKPEFFEVTRIPDDFDYAKTPESFYEVRPPRTITDDNASFLSDVGIVSALAEHCKLQWEERNFLPMMQWQRARLPKSEHRGSLIYRIGVSHGFAMGKTELILKHWKIDCDRFKTDIEGRLFADMFP